MADATPPDAVGGPGRAELVEAVTDARLVSSELAIAEVRRAMRRIERGDLVDLIARADAVLATVDLTRSNAMCLRSPVPFP